MHFDDMTPEEQAVLTLVDDWLSTTPEIFGDEDDEEIEVEESDLLDFLNDDGSLL